ncbi:MAG: exodeoxyribonuclease V subunit gamma, partial [Candidatus Obscuribacterales bacterium]|nr:exodeoxyribonuclease V subunit gamma [Candidatus Obscuribacterales bacterium]
MESSASNVELLVGPYRDGKTSVVLNELLDLKEQNPLANILILVPSARYGKLLKDRIAVLLKERQNKGSKTRGLFGLEIQPFYQCCQKIISRSGFEPQLIAEEIRPAIIAQILSEMKARGELHGLATIAEFPGTGSSVLELVDELQRAGLTPNDVIGRLKASSCQESHLLELARVYQHYFQKLKDLEFFDQKSLALAAREEIFKRREIDYDLLLIDGFDRVSHLQAQIFAGLAKHSAKTKMTFDYLSADEDQLTLEDQQHHGRSIIADDYRWKDSSFKELVNNLSPQIHQREAHEDNSVPKIESVSLLDPFLEMVEVARQVKAAIYQRGVKPSELIVITRSPETYNGAIEAAFDDAGLNYFIDGSSKISELEAWRFMRSLVTLPDNDFRRKDLIDLLRSPYMKLDALSMQVSDVSSIDRNSFKSRVIGSRKTWAKFLAHDDYSEYREQILNLLNHLQQPETEAPAAVHARYIEDLLDKYMQFPSSELNIRSSGAMHEREATKSLRRALKVLILQESVLKLKPDSFKQFWTHLQTLVEKANYARPRPQSSALTICAAELTPNMRF